MPTTSSSSNEIIDLVSDDEGKKGASNIVELDNNAARPSRKRRKSSHVPRNDEASLVSRKRAARIQRGVVNGGAAVLLEAGDCAVVSYGILERLLDDGTTATTTTARTCLASSAHGPQSSLQHIQQPDRWSCGFRNAQMVLTAVLPHLPASHAVFQRVPRRTPNATIPGLLQLQQAMEEAWRDGFDPKGAQHYRWKMVGKRSWIGAVEVATLLNYLGVDATVVQFVGRRQSREMLPRFVRAHFEKWTGREGCPFCPHGVRSKRCATGALSWASMVGEIPPPPPEPACSCPVLPLYLQWAGHSVTVAGIEADGTFLVYDPLKRGDQILASVSSPSSSSLSARDHRSWKPIRLQQMKELVSKDTQVVLCTLHSMNSADRRSCVDNPNGMVMTAGE